MDSILKDKKLLVLGGAQLSCEIIHKAQDMGIYVVVTDYNEVKDSPGKRIADESFMVSTTDVDAVVELIEKESIDGVIVGFNDMLLPYYAEICRRTGLPAYGTKEQFDIFINKDKYKALCREFNVPTVEEYTISKDNFANDILAIKYPVLVKPADSSGARGITICYSNEELEQAYEKARKFSNSGKVLVERYLTGKEATVFWIFDKGNYYLTALGNRHMKRSQEGVIPLPVGYTFPSKVLGKYQREVEKNVKNMLASVGIKDGMMFMQCKIEKGNCIVYDIGYRLTGSLEYKILKEISGFDPLEMMIHFALTGTMGEEKLESKVNPDFEKYGFNLSFLAKPGRIAEITGVETVWDIPQVIDAVVAHYPGEEITEDMRGLLSQIILRVLGSADNVQNLETLMKQIKSIVNVFSDMGEDMLLPGLTFEEILEDIEVK